MGRLYQRVGRLYQSERVGRLSRECTSRPYTLFFYFIHDLNFVSENLFFFIYPITIIYVNVMLRVYVFFLVSGGT